MSFTIAPLEADDAHEAALAHATMQASTYAHIAAEGFTGTLFSYLGERTQHLLEAELCLIAKSGRGNIVGLTIVGDGPEWWETKEGREFVPPAVNRALMTLFTMPGTHGSGLGAALLDAALPDGEPAYLWTMAENLRAIRFYEKHGFAADGFTMRSIGWGDMDMLRMVRTR